MTLIIGTPGMGKSYSLTWRALQSLASGRRVRLNFALRPDRVFVALRLAYGLSVERARAAVERIEYLRTWEDYVDAFDVDVFIDEAQDVYRATDWAIVPPEFITWNAQHRHRRVRIVLAAHRFGTIHNYVREGLLARVYIARPANWFLRLMRRVTHVGSLPLIQLLEAKNEEDERIAGARIGLAFRMSRTDVFPLDPIIANCYDHEGGVFMSPLDVTRRERSKHEGVQLATRSVRRKESRAVDGLPYLEAEEFAALRGTGQASSVLADRWRASARIEPKARLAQSLHGVRRGVVATG